MRARWRTTHLVPLAEFPASSHANGALTTRIGAVSFNSPGSSISSEISPFSTPVRMERGRERFPVDL
ncbi:hypothetical protein JCGZ_09445 [Jatropha curcas]|uniref:Uncharacterized protein n=1 Tax=Jatropha curcas TaxID=180498 RepID=A0A067KGE8_JATCU|nr:hypothetical protein JCGZ_09445 [Jatropha curcas]